jgi:hypothetical protein
MEHKMTINGAGVFFEHKCNAEENARANENPLVKAVKYLVGELDVDEYGVGYVNAINASFIMGEDSSGEGVRGVVSQIGYVLCNAKARTPKGKEARKLLTGIQAAYYGKNAKKLNALIDKAQVLRLSE